jgi:4-methylaminobutanoate oxidase (formaldehyde-forming)
LTRRLGDDAKVHLSNVTSSLAVISVMGPRSRELLEGLTPNDMSDAEFPFATSREIELAYARVRATRITYVGELGFELYIPSEFALGVYERLVDGGRAYGLTHAGYHALNSLRIEKAYRHWGHDICDEDSPLEAGLMSFVRPDKPGGFIGRDALMRQLRQERRRALLQFLLADPEPMLYHNEPIWRDGAIVGYVSSGMYGHTLGGAVGLGYVGAADGVSDEFLLSGTYEIEIAGERVPAQASLAPLYDPEALRVRC